MTGPEAVRAFAPGRVNLIGEHTDYNDGLALPFAISAGITVRAERAGDDEIRVHSCDLEAHDAFPATDPPRVRGWRAFCRGIVAELANAGVQVPGARLEIEGDVPRGSGLSSSAALEVAICLALRQLAGQPPGDPIELARLCSQVENEWVGAQTGLLDQLASLCGEPGRAVLIDFARLSTEPIDLGLDGHVLATLDSGEQHRLSGSRRAPEEGEPPEEGYNQRRAECRRACELLGIDSLRHATERDAAGLPAPLDDRVRHVIGENARVRSAVDALQAGDLARLGDLLDRSHASLRDLYAVSTPAVEQAVETMRGSGALGARIVGGGFGGHVLGLFAPGADLPDGALIVRPGPGAHVV